MGGLYFFLSCNSRFHPNLAFSGKSPFPVVETKKISVCSNCVSRLVKEKLLKGLIFLGFGNKS